MKWTKVVSLILCGKRGRFTAFTLNENVKTTNLGIAKRKVNTCKKGGIYNLNLTNLSS